MVCILKQSSDMLFVTAFTCILYNSPLGLCKFYCVKSKAESSTNKHKYLELETARHLHWVESIIASTIVRTNIMTMTMMLKTIRTAGFPLKIKNLQKHAEIYKLFTH